MWPDADPGRAMHEWEPAEMVTPSDHLLGRARTSLWHPEPLPVNSSSTHGEHVPDCAKQPNTFHPFIRRTAGQALGTHWPTSLDNLQDICGACRAEEKARRLDVPTGVDGANLFQTLKVMARAPPSSLAVLMDAGLNEA